MTNEQRDELILALAEALATLAARLVAVEMYLYEEDEPFAQA